MSVSYNFKLDLRSIFYFDATIKTIYIEYFSKSSDLPTLIAKGLFESRPLILYILSSDDLLHARQAIP